MIRKTILIALLLLAAPLLADDDPLADAFFPPELIMQNQQALGLTAEQKGILRGELQKAQPRFTELQFKLQDQMEILAGLAKEAAPDEAKVLAQLDQVLALEREIKRTQLTLMVRLKRMLTPEQRRQLAELRKKR